jgi:hypothetical protein
MAGKSYAYRQAGNRHVFRAFDVDFRMAALTLLAHRLIPSSGAWQSKSIPSLRSASARRDFRQHNVVRRSKSVPKYMLNEAEYIRTFGY